MMTGARETSSASGPSPSATKMSARTPASTATPKTTLAVVREDVIRCVLCPRLRSYCQRIARDKKAAHRDETYWGRPVPGFGDPQARVLIVGLAPAAHGANRTGRVFTGDGSGDFLMRALHASGFANIPTSRHVGDGLALRDAYILAVVRCAPPDNKPTPIEIARCRMHLRAELSALPHVTVVVALGRIAWDGYLAYRREEDARHESMGMTPTGTVAASTPRGPKPAFGHGAVFRPGTALPSLLGSYHPSRQNTNTGRLTPGMLDEIFARARRLVTEPA